MLPLILLTNWPSDSRGTTNPQQGPREPRFPHVMDWHQGLLIKERRDPGPGPQPTVSCLVRHTGRQRGCRAEWDQQAWMGTGWRLEGFYEWAATRHGGANIPYSALRPSTLPPSSTEICKAGIPAEHPPLRVVWHRPWSCKPAIQPFKWLHMSAHSHRALKREPFPRQAWAAHRKGGWNNPPSYCNCKQSSTCSALNINSHWATAAPR